MEQHFSTLEDTFRLLKYINMIQSFVILLLLRDNIIGAIGRFYG
jgi:hypothetical protein